MATMSEKTRQVSDVGPLLTGERPLPQSLDAEKAVLSCMLQDPLQTLDMILAALQDSQCFHYPPHRRIFNCLRDMRQDMRAEAIDLITLTARLERRGELDAVGGDDYLNVLLGTVPTTANAEKYVDAVLDAHILRSLIRTCGDIIGRCYEGTEQTEELIDSIEREILEVTELRTNTHPQELKALVKEAITYLNNLSKHDPETMGLPTGFHDLDQRITGLKRSELFVLAARPSIGKTALALNIARNVAADAHAAVGFFSLEMSVSQVVLRLLCSEARINLKDVRDGKLSNHQWTTDLMEAGERLRNMPIYLDDTPQITALELRQKARRMKTEHNISLIIIDYLQLMRASGGNKNTSREQEVARLSSEIKALAKELDVPIILLCQLNRQAEQSGAQPKLSHLRESGAIEQDADIVALLHRDRPTDQNDENKNSSSPMEDENNGVETKLIIAKHRNGEPGIITLAFFGQYTRFENFSRFDDADAPV